MTMNEKVADILVRMGSLSLELSEAWEGAGNPDASAFTVWPFNDQSLDELIHTFNQLAQEFREKDHANPQAHLTTLLMEAMDALKSAPYIAQADMARKIDAHLKSLDG